MIDIALQLYTVRDKAALDMAGTVKSLGDIGYKYVESAGYGNLRLTRSPLLKLLR
ncbi:hypothetical protein BH24CHL4_BH24CHL4_23160 [soil metagenome]